MTEAELIDIPLETLLIAQRDLYNQSCETHDFNRDGSAAILGVPFVPVIDGTSLPDHKPIGIWRAVAGDLVFENPTTRFAQWTQTRYRNDSA